MHARFHPPRALALATLGAGAPAAQAAWTLPQVLVRDRGAANVSAAGTGRGSEAFVWNVTSGRVIGAGDRTGAASYVRARIRRPDGRLGRARTISRTGAIVAEPQIGVDERGNATAVWAQAGRHLTIMAAVRPHGRRFGRPFELGRSRHFADARPALAVGRFGDTVVAWNSGRSIDVVRRGPSICAPRRSRECFGAPLRLRSGADQTVAVGPLGSAYVVWAAQTRTAGAVHTRLRMTVIRRDGRALGREHAVSRAADGDASQPSLAVRRDGTAIIAWRASLPAGASAFGVPTTMTPADVAAGSASLAVDPAGVAYLVYSAAAGTGATPGGAAGISHVRPPGGAFGSPVALPAEFTGAFVFTAGAKVTAVSGGSDGRTFISDWASQLPPAVRSRRGRRASRSGSRPRRRAGRA